MRSPLGVRSVARRRAVGGGTMRARLTQGRPQRRARLEALEGRTLLTTSDPLAGFLTGPNPGSPLQIAENYLAQPTVRASSASRPATSSTGVRHRPVLRQRHGHHAYLHEPGFRRDPGRERQLLDPHCPRRLDHLRRRRLRPGHLGNSASTSAPPTPSITAAQAILDAAAQLLKPARRPGRSNPSVIRRLRASGQCGLVQLPRRRPVNRTSRSTSTSSARPRASARPGPSTSRRPFSRNSTGTTSGSTR